MAQKRHESPAAGMVALSACPQCGGPRDASQGDAPDRLCAACRSQMLDSNPNHMIRRWPTIDAALDDPDFRHFLRQVERRYPHEKAERMMDELEIVTGNERAAYYTDEEYAASLLGLSIDALSQFGNSKPQSGEASD